MTSTRLHILIYMEREREREREREKSSFGAQERKYAWNNQRRLHRVII